LSLGDINDIAVGQTVIAIGNPFGLDGTLTKGIVSALAKFSCVDSVFHSASHSNRCGNQSRNSGGPLLDLQGRVIGVNAQIETTGLSQTNSGVGFAIPVSIVKIVVPDLIEKENMIGVVGCAGVPIYLQQLWKP
jgi:2-alkenal reductase